MNDRKRQRLVDETSELLDRIRAVLPERVQAIHDSMVGWPSGISYETDRSSGHGRTIVWCDEHERELLRCHADQYDCAGAVINPPTDLTGESAITHDRAAEDLKGVDTHIRVAAHQLRLLERRLMRYQTRPATDRERRETLGDAQNEKGCELCAELFVAPGVKRWEPVWKSLRVVSDEAPVDLCRWCGSFVRDTGRRPTRSELEAHHRGQRVPRSA